MTYTLALTGPMGVGKSTLLRKISDTLCEQNKDVYSDTHFAFNDLHKSSLFTRRFDNAFDSYSFQLSCMLTSYEYLLRCESSQMNYITDFWFSEILNVYLSTYLHLGFITEEQYDSLITNNYNLFANLPTPNQIVYIKSDPKTIVDNIIKRGRYNESEEERYFLECFTTDLVKNFDITIDKVKNFLNSDVITLQPQEMDNFVSEFCKKKMIPITN